MELDKLLAQVEAIRRAPLQVCCRTPAGKVIVTSVEEAARQHCHYFHIVADDLDELLSKALK
mgnify:CR=1 FL=1